MANIRSSVGILRPVNCRHAGSVHSRTCPILNIGYGGGEGLMRIDMILLFELT